MDTGREDSLAGLVSVDTDLVIDFLRVARRGAPLVRELIGAGRFRVTAITAFELRLGADILSRGDQIMCLLSSRPVPLDLPSALRAGEVFSTLKSIGMGIGVDDCMMAGICLRHGLLLGHSKLPPVREGGRAAAGRRKLGPT